MACFGLLLRGPCHSDSPDAVQAPVWDAVAHLWWHREEEIHQQERISGRYNRPLTVTSHDLTLECGRKPLHRSHSAKRSWLRNLQHTVLRQTVGRPRDILGSASAVGLPAQAACLSTTDTPHNHDSQAALPPRPAWGTACIPATRGRGAGPDLQDLKRCLQGGCRIKPALCGRPAAGRRERAAKWDQEET